MAAICHETVAKIFQAAFREHVQIADRTEISLINSFLTLVDLAAGTLKSGGKLILFGNGGSAADAQHIAAEFVVRYREERPALAAVALTCDTSIITAAANDYSYDAIFARQVEALGRPGDLAIGISTSGNSNNVILGLEAARASNIAVAGLAGRDGGRMASICAPLLIVPCDTVARIQEMHILLGHILCESIDGLYSP